MTNRLQNLPFDMQDLIYIRLFRLYMKDLIPELYEASLEYEYRKAEYGPSDDEKDEDYEAGDSDSDDDSEYSFYSSSDED